MAKRKKLVAPSTDDLSRIEEEFRRETPARDVLGSTGRTAPIAQIAADSAALAQPGAPADRAEYARLQASDDILKHAQGQGLLMAEVSLDDIEADVMIRDRSVIDEAQLLELRESIAAHGLRLPIEIFELAAPTGTGAHYGLLSGYRRLMAVRGLYSLTNDARYRTIRAIVRPRMESDGAFVSMVEENEVRANLSHFERGRIAVIAAQQGAFVNTEEAVNRLFASGSKAKRSKVRSFAIIFEELGDMLSFPDALTETRGLKVAQALRQGAENQLRDALANGTPMTAAEEWAVLEAEIATLDAAPKDPRRGGRPATAQPVSGWQNADTLVTSSGVTIRKQLDSKGYILRFEGKQIDDNLMDSLLAEIQHLLEKP